jgi:hypothetical protein
MTETCDYGGCSNEATHKVTHEGVHRFCDYHNDNINP